MAKGPLQLRPWPFIVAAYLASPIVGVNGAWIASYGPWASKTAFRIPSAWDAWPGYFIFGAPIGLIAEILLATPLLIGFARWGWRWVNGWTACAIAFAASALVALNADGAFASPPGDVEDNVVFAAHGVRTLAGWVPLLSDAASWGLIGAATALAFRLIAVRLRRARSA